MADPVLELADALTVKAVQLLGWDAQRRYDVIQDRKALGDKLRVFVFPNADELELLDEGNDERIEINVALQKAVKPENVEQIDACVKELRRFKALYGVDGALRDEELAGCMWRGVLDNSPLWNPEWLLTKEIFLSIITVGYRTDQ